MNPSQTLADLYEQIALIREFICSLRSGRARLLEIPSMSGGTVFGQLVVESDYDFNLCFNSILSFVSIHAGNLSDSNKEILDQFFNYLFSSLEPNIQTDATYLISYLTEILIRIVVKANELKQSQYTLREVFPPEFGNRELTLHADRGYVVIQIISYPSYIGKEFYFSGSLPSGRGITITQGVMAAFYSTKIDAFIQSRIRVLNQHHAIAVPLLTDLLLLSVYDNIETKVLHYY